MYHVPRTPHCRLYHPPFGRNLRQNVCISICRTISWAIVTQQSMKLLRYDSRQLSHFRSVCCDHRPTSMPTTILAILYECKNKTRSKKKYSLLSVFCLCVCVGWESRGGVFAAHKCMWQCWRCWSCQSNQISNACIRGPLCRFVSGYTQHSRQDWI